VSEATQFPDAKLRNADRQGGNQTDKIENMTEAEPVTPSNPPKISHFFRRLFQQHRPSADIRIKSPNFSEPDIRTTHLIWSVVYRKATERRGPSLVAPAFSCDSRFPAGSSSVDLPLHVPIVPMSVKIPVAPMLYIETSFEPEFVT
jgi:hypothetical protein